MLRNWIRVLLDAVRVCNAGAWVDWTADSFAIGRGPEPTFVESRRRLGEDDDTGELLAKIFWVLLGGVRPSSI